MQVEKYSSVISLVFVFLEAVVHCGRSDVGICEDIVEVLLSVGEGQSSISFSHLSLRVLA